MPERPLQGLPAAPGLAAGRARLDSVRPGHAETVPLDRRKAEVRRAHAALEAAAAELEALAERLAARGREAEAEIVRTGVLMAGDPALVEDVERAVLERGMAAPAAVMAACERHAEAIAALGDATLAARAEDVRSLGRRAARLAAEVGPAGVGPAGVGRTGVDAAEAGRAEVGPADVVLIAEDLGPADVAEIGPEVVGVALARGGPTAHAAVVARGLGLPMAVGLGEQVLDAEAGDIVVLDGGVGRLVLGPDAARVAEAEAALAARRAQRARALADRALPARTRDGHAVRVLVNAATRPELEAGMEAGAEGIGLLRTELHFLEHRAWPTEAEHRASLGPVLGALAGRTATVRVLDFGGDKTPPFLAGTTARGLALLLEHPAELDAQLRAIVAAGAQTELRVLLPMVESPAQVDAVRCGLPEGVRLGAMIETVAAVAAAPAIAAAADFVSIGTNDLAHAVLGSDRFGGGHAPADAPAVLAAIAAVARAARGARRTLEVCGEAASEPATLPLLVGLGADELSVGAARVGAVRAWVRALDFEAVRREAAARLTQPGDAAGEGLERDGRVLAVGPET